MAKGTRRPAESPRVVTTLGSVPANFSKKELKRLGVQTVDLERPVRTGGYKLQRVVPNVNNLWIETQPEKGWTAAMRLSLEGGRARVSELRLFPAEDLESAPTGEWSACVLGARAWAPQRGITQELLSRVKTHVVLQYHEEIRKEAGTWADMLQVPSETAETKTKSSRGRKALSDEFLAKVAKTYVDGLASKKPVEHVCGVYAAPKARVTGWITRARDRGFLEGRYWGKAGGVLSEKTKRLLARRGRAKPSTPNKRATKKKER